MWRTSARVSRSVIAGIPQSVSHESQPLSALARVLAVDGGAHDRRPRVDAIRFHRVGADTVVADHRVGERDQLAGVARVGHRLLVAGHRGREHDLPDRRRVGAAGEAVEPGAVLKQDVCGRLGAHRALTGLPATESVRVRWAMAPAATVRSTRPCKVRPWKQQFAERLTYPSAPTSN